MDRIKSFFDELRGKKVAFLGLGVSHIETIKLFLKKDISVLVCDKKSKEEFESLADALAETGAQLCFGENYEEYLKADVIFRTPGIPYHHEDLEVLRHGSKIITSEMEVFFQLCPCLLIGVTGSDGKTTTTTLINEMLTRQGYRTHLGGNIGKALLPLIDEIQPKDIAVVELSSFQLISMGQSPHIAVVTNISPNHLDVHGDMEEYVGAKKQILAHQTGFGRAVLNHQNQETYALKSCVRGELSVFLNQGKKHKGAFLNREGMVCYWDGWKEHLLVHQDEVGLPGIHNLENVMAAITTVYPMVSKETMVFVAKNFTGVPHRLEFVGEFYGVKYYNDSIATSPTRAMAALESFSQKIILLAGGYNKKLSFEELAQHIVKKVKYLILMGEAAEEIKEAVQKVDSSFPCHLVASMEEGVGVAKEKGQTGDVVSLSPACASFDAYPNFEVRGNHFKEIVRK